MSDPICTDPHRPARTQDLFSPVGYDDAWLTGHTVDDMRTALLIRVQWHIVDAARHYDAAEMAEWRRFFGAILARRSRRGRGRLLTRRGGGLGL